MIVPVTVHFEVYLSQLYASHLALHNANATATANAFISG